MPQPSSISDGYATEHEWFATTHWSVVVASAQRDSPQASEALENLCRTYRPPILTFVRRHCRTLEDAEDLTQSFLARLLEKNFWARADRRKGRFRCLLLKAARQFLLDQRDRAQAVKRGEGVVPISLDERMDEGCFDACDQGLSCEQQFDRRCAWAVLDQARARLEQEYKALGKAAFYERVHLLGGSRDGSPSYGEIGRQLGLSVSAIKSAVFRLRERYAELVREEVARTVSHPAEVDAEIKYLLSVISA